MNGSMPIRGRRIYLRPFEAMDFMDVYSNYASDPEVCKYLTWAPHSSSEETLGYLTAFLPSYQDSGFYHWAIELPTVGVIGAIEVVEKDAIRSEATLGYVLGRSYWNQGFMSEALGLVLSYLEDEGFVLFKAECLKENIASQRVLEKAGFSFLEERKGTVKGEAKAICVYERKKGAEGKAASSKKEEHGFTISGEGVEEEPIEASYFFPFGDK